MTDSMQREWAADGMWRGLRRTFQTPDDLRLAARIGLFLVTMPRALDRSPLNHVLGDIDSSRAVLNLTTDVDRISRLRQAWLESPLFRSRNTCYVRAITLYRFLADKDGVLRIHFGVEPGVSSRDRLRGHAWVTRDGVPLEAPEPVLAGRVRELYSYPEHA